MSTGLAGRFLSVVGQWQEEKVSLRRSRSWLESVIAFRHENDYARRWPRFSRTVI